jgi:hypothetical protein
MAEVDWAILCDYAFQDSGRKACLIGIFDRIFAMAVPAQQHHMALVIRFTGGQPNSKVKFKVEIVRPPDAGGAAMASAGGEAQLGDTGAGEFIVNFAGFPLPDFGPYAVNVHPDEEGAQTKMVTFTVQRPLIRPAEPEPTGD